MMWASSLRILMLLLHKSWLPNLLLHLIVSHNWIILLYPHFLQLSFRLLWLHMICLLLLDLKFTHSLTSVDKVFEIELELTLAWACFGFFAHRSFVIDGLITRLVHLKLSWSPFLLLLRYWHLLLLTLIYWLLMCQRYREKHLRHLSYIVIALELRLLGLRDRRLIAFHTWRIFIIFLHW